MRKISLTISLGEEAPKEVPKGCKPLTVEEKVRIALDEIELEQPGAKVAWGFLKRVNNYLMRKEKLTKRQENLLKLIYAMMSKYGQHDPEGVELPAEKIVKLIGNEKYKTGYAKE